MYAPFFGLKQEAFSIAPDPRFLFMSERHREALAHLLYGLGAGGGFVLLTGEIGAGKTTVCRCFLEQIPRRCNVAYIFNPKLSAVELLRTVCDEFGIPVAPGHAAAPSVKDHLDPLNEYLLRTHAVGQDNVLIIDEAQSLAPDVLEQLRLLTNLETNERKLLQIILIGQPELRTMLARPELVQLAQRVIARFHLEALSTGETAQYVAHRLAVAGLAGPMPFDARALGRIHGLTGGVPRRINLLCDRALLGAYATGQKTIDRAIVEKAAGEVFGRAGAVFGRAGTADSAPKRRAALVALGLAFALGAVLAGVGFEVLDAGRALAPAMPSARTAPVALAPARVAGAGATVASVVASAASAAGARLSPAVLPAASTSPSASAPASVPTSAPASAPAADVLLASELSSRDGPAVRDEKTAWRELARLWKLEPGDTEPCAAFERVQVRCFRSASSNLALIRQLDRPGILTLRDANDAPVYVLLTGLTSRQATLRLGAAERTVSLGALARLWRGDFATLWRAPPGYQNVVTESDSGALAEWLAGQLARADGAPPIVPAPALKSRIAAFQLAQGLRADGLAGPTTLMQLNRATGIDEPRLAVAPAPN